MEQPLAESSDAVPAAANAPAVPVPAGARQEDLHTLGQLKRGNWAAMEVLVTRYQDRLFATVLRIVGHPEDAADLVQETFVRAMQHVADFEGKSSLYTWLFRIAVNLSLSHRRTARRHPAVSLEGSGDGETLNQQAAGLRRALVQATEAGPAEQAELHAEHERVLAALALLEPAHRAVIVLRDVEGCDYEEIGRILELPSGTIKSRLFRARAALRVAFGRDAAMDGARARGEQA